MENIETLVQKIRDYLELSGKIATMESALSGKNAEYNAQFSNRYSKLKRDLSEYLTKIMPTVETVVGIYKNKIALRDDKILLPEGVLYCEYNCLNACDVAMALGNESIKLLSMIVKRTNVDVNLREFARRYNTVVDIYKNIETLKTKAINQSTGQNVNEIALLKLQRSKICFSEREFNNLVSQVSANSDVIKNQIIIEDRMELAKNYSDKITIPLGYEFFDGSRIGKTGKVYLSTLDWNLHNDGFVVIRRKNQNVASRELATLANNTALHFLFKYPSLSKRILLCDSYSSFEITTFAGSLKDALPTAFFGGEKEVRNSKDDIKTSFSQLNKTINERIMLLGQSRYQSILEYNLYNQDNPQPIILVVMNGYPTKYEDAYDEITSVLKNGKKAGVFFFIVENTEIDEDSKYYTKHLPNLDLITKNIVNVEIINGITALCKDNKKYGCDTRGASYDVKSILSSLKTNNNSGNDQTVYLENVLEKENFQLSKRRTDFSKNLSIPIGKKGASPINLELRADGPTAHMAIIGTTGSGKTAFINTLVLSLCNHYSPSEVEMHLMVMKKGDFTVFKDNNLPHLKTIVTGSDTLSANDILDFLSAEMSRRTTVMKNQDIYVYNKTASVKMPRCVVIIDEFSELVKESDEAIKQIESIAQMGRSFGISLIVSSTQFPPETNSIKHLFGNRIEFKSDENAGQLIPEAYDNQSTLIGTKGLCFYSNGGNVHTVKVAYSEEGQKLANHISNVRNKYPSFKMELQSDIKAVKVAKESDAPFTVKNAKIAYDEEGIISTRLGKTYLTNKSVEYQFDSSSNVLFLFGHYLKTKEIEASLIKDTLVLSKDIDEATAYYIDLNKNKSLKRHDNLMKHLKDKWELSGKVAYCDYDGADEIFEELKDIINTRENDMDSEIYPILVVISKADDYLMDDDKRDDLLDLINSGKENNVYFVIQCNEYVNFFGAKSVVLDAIIFPDREIEGSENYSSSMLCASFEEMLASTTPRGTKLLRNASANALNPMLHLLCVKNKFSLFVPYANEENYLKNAVD